MKPWNRNDHPTPRWTREMLIISLVAPIAFSLMSFAAGATCKSVGERIIVMYGSFIVYPLLTMFVISRVARYVEPGSGPVRTSAIYAGVAMVVTGIAAYLFADIARLAHAPITSAKYIMISTVISAAYIFPISLVQRFRWEHDRVNRALSEERQARLGAQLAALQARLSPHFLFNTINTVASLIPTDPALAEATLVRMASLLRYALDESRNSTVSLRRELEAVEDYLNVQCARFGDRFAWSIDNAVGIDDARVPPLALQRLVENSVVHGVGNRKNLGRILVVIERQGGDVVCTVRDNGSDGNTPTMARGTGTGISDLRESLRIHYGDRGSLTTSSIDGGGYVACLRLPALEVVSA